MPDRVRELSASRGLEVRQQIELATAVGAVMNSAGGDYAKRIAAAAYRARD